MFVYFLSRMYAVEDSIKLYIINGFTLFIKTFENLNEVRIITTG